MACRFSVEKSTDSLMGVPLYVICCFSLVAFNISSQSLIFVSVNNVCLSVFLLVLILPGTLCASWTWLNISFLMVGKFSAIISSNIFSCPFSLLLHANNVNVGAFNVFIDVYDPVIFLIVLGLLSVGLFLLLFPV